MTLLNAAHPRSLADAVRDALETGPPALDALVQWTPTDRRDRFLALHAIYDLHSAPLEVLGSRVRWQHHPAVAALKSRLEEEWLAELEAHAVPDDLPTDVVGGMRALAARDRLPAPYKWLAREATWEQLVDFLALEGGPDGGFDDLVAICQVGLSGSAKLELAQNYWDEMGNGNADAVHTVLHQRLVTALDLPRIPRAEQPTEALERCALSGLFATNRWLQPEMVGALGLLELQAGPRCRLVLKGLERLGAPADALPFYVEHADVDPRHGKDWLEKAIVPLAAAQPDWVPRMLRGAWWRSHTNLAFFDAVWSELSGRRAAA